MNYTPTYNKEQFAALTQPQRIVVICQDVIARVQTKNYEMIRSEFLLGRNEVELDDLTASEFQQRANTGECCGCAKGAIVVSYIGALNEKRRKDFSCCVDVRDRPGTVELVGIFGPFLLDAIEVAFEGTAVLGTIISIRELRADIVNTFGDYVWGSDHGLTIFKHIIEHGGKMVLTNGVVIDHEGIKRP